SGLYTAPATAPSVAITVTATSVANSAISAKATVSLSAATPGVAVAISPTSATVADGATRQFTATVTGATNTTVIWQVNGVTGGSSATGAISSAGLYTAPACFSGTVTVTARSFFDTSAFADAHVTVTSGTVASGFYVSPTGSDSNNGSACSP